MTGIPTQDEAAETIKAALNAALADVAPAGEVKAYDYDEIPGGQYGNVPGPLPALYVAIDLSRVHTDVRRLNGEVALVPGRLGTRYCADTVSNARELQRLVTGALEAVILPGDLGPFSFEVEAEPIHRDALGFTGVDDWTF